MLKVPDLIRRLKVDPPLLLRLADTLGELRKSGPKIATCFNLHGHPSLMAVAGRRKLRREAVADVFYRQDAKTQHQFHAALQAAMPQRRSVAKATDSVNHGLRHSMGPLRRRVKMAPPRPPSAATAPSSPGASKLKQANAFRESEWQSQQASPDWVRGRRGELGGEE